MTDPTPTEQAAIDAMVRAGLDLHFEFGRNVGLHKTAVEMLRAVPLDYCVQRAIGEGALIPATTQMRVRKAGNRIDTLYRLASENETPGIPAEDTTAWDAP